MGHPGETLHLVAEPDVVVAQRPTICAACQTSLEDEAATAVVACERRQVQDLPPIRLRVTEYQALSVRCSACQQVTAGAFPAAAPSQAQYGPRLRALAISLVAQQFVPYARTRDLLADLCGAHLSVGTLVEWVQQSAQTLEPVEAELKQPLRHAPVLYSDDTGVRRGGRLARAHMASTARLTHYVIHAKRGAEATDTIGILSGYRGVSVHDGWKPYLAQTACRHALCHIHHLRELTFVEEQYQQPWARDLKELLLEMRTATEQARAQGRLKQSPTRNPLERLWLGQEQAFVFLDDLTIPFDNNQAERDLRLLKTQQKFSGCFRSEPGGAAFARLRSYLSTLRKQGAAVLTALESLFTSNAFYPAFA